MSIRTRLFRKPGPALSFQLEPFAVELIIEHKDLEHLRALQSEFDALTPIDQRRFIRRLIQNTLKANKT